MATLVSITLAGCAVPGRFSREQYAQLDSDPFLSEGSDTSVATTPVAERSVAMTAKQTEEATGDRFAFVADEDGSISPECESGSAPPVADTKTQPTEALASFFEAPDVAEVPKKLVKTVAHADDEFSRFMTSEKNQVVHATAEFVDTLETARGEVQQSVEQAGFWGFPGDRPADSSEVMPVPGVAESANPFFDGEAAEKPNPFAAGSSAPEVAPPADVFGEESDTASWPPGDFEFN